MTASTTVTDRPTRSEVDHGSARRALVPVALTATAVAATLSVLEAHSVPEWIVEVGIELICSALVFGVVVRLGLRRPSAGGRAIVLGVIGLVVLVPAFWTGLPLLLGTAALLLGVAGRRAGRGAGSAVAGLILGAMCVVGYASIYIIDWVVNH